MPNAQIRFTQNAPGPGVGGNGLALLGVQGTSVLVENVDNSNVDKAQFELLYVPPSSALTTGTKQAYSSTLTWSFTPDSTECFVVRLRVKDVNGNESIDDRVFGILETTGRLQIPVARGAAMNFAGNAQGWLPYQRQFNKMVDTLDVEDRGAPVNVTDADQSLTLSAGRTRRLQPSTLTASRTITLLATGASVGDRWTFTRFDQGAFTVTFVGGPGGTQIVMPVSARGCVVFRFNGTDWEPRLFSFLPVVADPNTTATGIPEVYPNHLRRPERRVALLWQYARGYFPPTIP